MSIAVIRAEGINSDRENASSPVEQPNESSLGSGTSVSASLTAPKSGGCRFHPVVGEGCNKVSGQRRSSLRMLRSSGDSARRTLQSARRAKAHGFFTGSCEAGPRHRPATADRCERR